MKNRTKSFFAPLGCILSFVLAPAAFANHRSGDFPLPGLMTLGDFNQDGKIDLAVCVEGFDNLAILTGDGQGGFSLQSHVKTDTLPKGLDAGDINGDGHLDLVSIDKWGYNIRVNLGDGTGGFSFANEVNGDGEPTRIRLR
ncbi:MAG TPA: VCBS repeat-containing protein, partial [Chthoniobacterales bacterium]